MSYKRTNCAEFLKDPSTAQTAKVDDNKTLLVTQTTREHEVFRVAPSKSSQHRELTAFLASYRTVVVIASPFFLAKLGGYGWPDFLIFLK